MEDPAHPGEYDLNATVIDRDQSPVTDFCRVRFEVSTSENLATLQFTGPGEGTASGLITTGAHAGGGVYTTRVTGVLTPEAMGLVVVEL